MRLKYNFEMMQLEDYHIAVPVGEDVQELRGVIKLNETAAHIFGLLKDDVTEDEIVKEMQQVYDIEPSVLEQEVKQCLETFEQKGLLI